MMASPQMLDLPRHILHPPTHPNHVVSLYTSLLAVKRCLNLEAAANQQGYDTSLSIEATCHAWTLLAEIGMMILNAGFGDASGPGWAGGISADVEHAISEGIKLSLTSKTALRPFWIHLTALHAHLTLWQHNVKFSRAILKRLRSSLTRSDPPAAHYSALLATHANLLSPVPSHSSSTSDPKKLLPPSSPSTLSVSDIQGALQLTTELNAFARQNGPGHKDVVLLSVVLRLRTLVRAEMWHSGPSDDLNAANSVESLLPHCEAALSLSFDEHAAAPPAQPQQLPQEIIHLQIHALIIGVLYYTLVGDARASSLRLTRLHLLLDANPSDPDATAHVKFNLGPSEPPLVIQSTHPRVLFELAFLVSSVSKRDLVGRKPRRKLFAQEGLKIADAVGEEMFFPIWSTLGDVREVEARLAKVKADFLCEMAAVSIIRSEFEEAVKYLDCVIAHTRTYSIFPFYAARITLHQAHLAHAMCQPSRALACYRAAAWLDSESSSSSTSPNTSFGGRTGGFVGVAARAGEVGLLLGLRAQNRRNSAINQGKGKEREIEDTALDQMAREVIEKCKAYPGTLAAVGKVLEAVTSGEIVKAKQRLKSSLDIATASQDNHLRALVIALTSAHYVHTASDHAKMMLDTARQLAAGMGAPATKPTNVPSQTQSLDDPSVLGNVPLSLWVGERFYELYVRQGDGNKAHAQQRNNEALRAALRALPTRYSKH